MQVRFAWLFALCALGVDAASAAGVAQYEVFRAGEGGYLCFRIPALLFTSKKTLLAFAEGRGAQTKTCSDHAPDVRIVMKSSSDFGKTWSNISVVHSEDGHTIGNPAPVIDSTTGRIILGFCRDNKEVFTLDSTDGGKTWINLSNITAVANGGRWAFVGTGPPGGIQLPSGRLVIGMYASGPGSFVIYTDDGGKSWHRSQPTGNSSTGECQVATLGSGDTPLLILAMRSKSFDRLLAFSNDSGDTWSNVTQSTSLDPQTTCEGSIVSVSYKGAFMDTHLYFSAPHSTKRLNMTVFTSSTGGQTWEVGHVLWDGPSAYSSLAYNQVKMYCLYERGVLSYEETLTLAVFSTLI